MCLSIDILSSELSKSAYEFQNVMARSFYMVKMHNPIMFAC